MPWQYSECHGNKVLCQALQSCLLTFLAQPSHRLAVLSGFGDHPHCFVEPLALTFCDSCAPFPCADFVRLLVTTGVALIYGLTYLGEGKLDPAGVEIANIQNIMASLLSAQRSMHRIHCIGRGIVGMHTGVTLQSQPGEHVPLP